MFSKPDSRFFKQRYIDQTYAYFDKYGGRTLIVAQFIPFVRTYASVAAGVGADAVPHFAIFNAIGVVLWAGGVTMLGYLLGNITFIKENIEALLVLVVFMSVAPVIVEVWRKNRKDKKLRAAGLPVDEAGATRATTSRPSATRSSARRSARDAPRPPRDPLVAVRHGRRPRARGHRAARRRGVRHGAARR